MAHPALQAVLARHHFHYRDFLDLHSFTLLEQPLPNLAADRIDYTLRDLYKLGVLAKSDIEWFLEGLRVHEGRIVVGSAAHARWFKLQYTYLTEQYFAGAQNQAANRFLRALIEPYYEAGQLTLADFEQDDAYLLGRLREITGQPVTELYSTWMQSEPPDLPLALKPRFVDPEILLGEKIVRLSELGDAYA
ncbi:hypothetical protein [Hymenobacter volaticus]|uniref:Uncharacterized protein n=1 Tax=Hymenobacter volaticus TaxID=2932254 RepID=A0ABY4GFG2_9BACT|nr:hypothetical protein [Hymenobacter volaticus]UOQ69687.1 hypothetical protein MUN86_29140 [Hymenobacter volaticus]